MNSINFDGVFFAPQHTIACLCCKLWWHGSARMEEYINSAYPDIPYLRKQAQKKIPRFAFEYLDGGCNAEVNLRRNASDLQGVRLQPYYLRDFQSTSLETSLFGKQYSAPFGIAPIGLQGLIWPNSPEILAKAALAHNIPFVLSTVSTESIERIADVTEGNAWFQLYHPREAHIRDQLLKRLEDANYPVLVLLADTPVFGYRPKEIINGLAVPPKMTISNIVQMMRRPHWTFETLKHGKPSFKSLEPYLPKGLNLKHLGLFMDQLFDGRLSADRLKYIRDRWKGKLVLKGVVSEEDVQKAVDIGLDGIIVSNHGGRQLDLGDSSINSLASIVQKYHQQITIMMDSGIRSGPDIAASIAVGASFTFLGRSFMYGVAALGKDGGQQTISILKRQLRHVMEQLGCEHVQDLPNHLIAKEVP